jgi:hypothetical protein
MHSALVRIHYELETLGASSEQAESSVSDSDNIIQHRYNQFARGSQASTPREVASIMETLDLLLEQVEELHTMGADVLTNVQAVSASTGASDTLRNRVSIKMMDEQLEIQRAELDEARRSVMDSMQEFKVPDEVATLSPDEGLDDVELSEYWLYFDAMQKLHLAHEIYNAVIAKATEGRVSHMNLEELEKTHKEMEDQMHLDDEVVEEMYFELAVPDEVRRLSPAQALTQIDLKEYWPYFDEIEARAHNRAMINAIRARLAQGRFEARVAAETISR